MLNSLSTQQLKQLALISYFSLLGFMLIWLLWLNPSSLPLLLALCLFVLPLLLPIKGLLQGNPYTYAWTNFIVMWYFLHGITTWWVSEGDKLWASIELLLATCLFIFASYYAKYRGQELGLSIRKQK